MHATSSKNLGNMSLQVQRLCMAKRSHRDRAIQWIGCCLFGVGYGVLVTLIFRPNSAAGFTAELLGAGVAFAVGFHWVFIERPDELAKKLGEASKEHRARQRESLQDGWPPN